jgi:predicted amidophosphoribosyltransferase
MAIAWLDEIVTAVAPGRCPGCGARGPAVCNSCLGRLKRAPTAPPPAPIAWWTACFAYEGVAREIIARSKYRHERAALRMLARELPTAVARVPAAIDLVTFAPASRARYARTGVDHGAVIARVTAEALGVQFRPLLGRRAGDGEQTGRDAASRRRGPRVRATVHVPCASILLVDDVATTGGTLAAAARALLASGARTVFAATIARTPRPGGTGPIDAYTSGSDVR